MRGTRSPEQAAKERRAVELDLERRAVRAAKRYEMYGGSVLRFARMKTARRFRDTTQTNA